MQAVPAFLNNLVDFLPNQNSTNFSTLRNLDIGGEITTVKLFWKLKHYLPKQVLLWNIYGPAETTVDCTFRILDININEVSIPIGHPLPHYQCFILDECLQCAVFSQEGELYVGGAGVFAGYLERDDLTARGLLIINDEPFYRTGDLVYIDTNGLLHYRGRKDYQIKLHGQRIELGEIEQCLLKTSISTCVVIQWNHDYLIAYVQSSSIDEEQLRKYCQSHLPAHMVPSIFIILDRLPLNSNGKIDRKLLPTPDLFPNSSSSKNDSK
ncbi:unnamed protein product, partial [Rotaria sp. Silwood1]